jgi:acyl-coenzyme A synthetase/AMP-(fatty) acid ligase
MNPREVGSLLFSHPEVAEVCVLTVPNPHAFVVLAPNASTTLESLRVFCQGQIPQLDDLQITLLDDMPKTRTGAVDRGQLVDMAQDLAPKKNVA